MTSKSRAARNHASLETGAESSTVPPSPSARPVSSRGGSGIMRSPESISAHVQRARNAHLDADNSQGHLKPFPSWYSNTGESSSNARFDDSSAQWWESVLPPGQLTERLRRAQRSPASSRGPTPLSSSRTSPRSSPVAPADCFEDDSYRQQHSASHLGGEKHHRKATRSLMREKEDSNRRSPKMRSMTAITTLPSTSQAVGASTRSSNEVSQQSMSRSASTGSSFSLSDRASVASTSSNDESPPPGQSPLVRPEQWTTRNFANSNSKGAGSFASQGYTHTVSRSQSNRRSRVYSDDGFVNQGLGLGLCHDDKNTHPLNHAFEEQVYRWHSARPFHSQPLKSSTMPSRSLASSVHIVPRSSSRTSLTTPSAESSGDSSNEERARKGSMQSRHDSSQRSSNRLSQNASVDTFPRRSSLRSREKSPTGAEADQYGSALSDWPHTQGETRHVSFLPAVELVDRNQGVYKGSLENPHRSTSSMRGAARFTKRGSDFGPSSSQSSSQSARSIFQFPGESDTDTRLNAHHERRGQRVPSQSAPSSPRETYRALYEKEPWTDSRSRKAGRADNASIYTRMANDQETSSAEMALLSSLGVAQAQFASARNLAGALTRQLSAPLRPMLHVTLFVSISSMAFMALSGFLIAGYLVTIWDDLNAHSKIVQRNVSNARRSIDASVTWSRQLLGGPAPIAGQSDRSNVGTIPKGGESSPSASEPKKQTYSSSNIWNLALGLPAALVQTVAPSSIVRGFKRANSRRKSEAMSTSSSKHEKTPSASNEHARNCKNSPHGSSSQSMPPRPPLSSLLPSIALTVVIALGAGLASFFANRAASQPASPSAAPSSASTRAERLHEHTAAQGLSGRRTDASSPHLHSRATSMCGGGKMAGVQRSFRSTNSPSASRRTQSSATPPADLHLNRSDRGHQALDGSWMTNDAFGARTFAAQVTSP